MKENLMALTTPDWLVRHDGALRQTSLPKTWVVLLRGEAQYRLVTAPAGGQHACQVTQTVNGKRLESGSKFPSEEEALRGGLEDLRKALGW
jgi:hypothetical protein